MELNSLYTSQAEYALQRLQGRHYEHGKKAGRLLAAQLRQSEAALAIPALRNPDGELDTKEEVGFPYKGSTQQGMASEEGQLTPSVTQTDVSRSSIES
ncbi:hypothetical protein NDU88_009815 [Pleurodeles waltl]|uniref:Uncharacterized protein n=1 Tax=Pleurodeles waltl TaxID=8319 RepID=A0AAV7QVP9_PLEWA|nr:hypothetical protein NDU88_009815 [Pleurodeles waltl]